MNWTKLVFTIAAVSSLLTLGAKASSVYLEGIVEYSFDENYRLVRTDQHVYQLKAGALRKDKELFEKPGSLVSVRLRPGLIERVWPIGNLADETSRTLASTNCTCWGCRK